MTFAEMKADVRRRLNESSTVFYTDADIEDALNDGLAEISDATEWYERQVTITVLPKRRYYDLSGLIDEPFLSLRRCWNTTTQKWLDPSEPREMDHGFRQWERPTGQPEKYFLRGNWWLGLWLKPATENAGVRVYHTALPDAMSAASDEPGFPREFHYGIVEYALSDLYAQQRETKKALTHWDGYKGYEEGLGLYVDQRQGLDRVNVL